MFSPVPYQWPSNRQQSLQVNLYPWIWVSLDNTDLVFAMPTLLAITREDSKKSEKRHRLLNTQNVPGDSLAPHWIFTTTPRSRLYHLLADDERKAQQDKLTFLKSYAVPTAVKKWLEIQNRPSGSKACSLSLAPWWLWTWGLPLDLSYHPPPIPSTCPPPSYIYTQAIRELRIFLKQERSPEA